MTDTANAPERIWAFHAGPMVGLFIGKKEVGTNVAEYVLATHCDELVAAAYLDARDSINEYPRVAPEADEANAYDEQIEHCQGIIDARTPDNARAAMTARDERMKAEGAREAQAKIARLTEALKDAVEIVHKSYVLATMEAVNAGPASPIAASHDAWRAKCVRVEEAARAALQENADG